MSRSISVNAMVGELQRRLPIGIPIQTCVDRLNEAFRWLNGQGHFVWNLDRTTVNIAADGTFLLPTGRSVQNAPSGSPFDPGRPAYLTIDPATAPYNTYGGLEIPYKPYDVAIKHQTYNTSVSVGQFSVWTFFGYQTVVLGVEYYDYQGLVYPRAAWPVTPNTIPATLIYHRSGFGEIPRANGTTTYFPVPETVDAFLIDRAESELRRVYGMGGYQEIMAGMQQTLAMILDVYRSTKPAMMGMIDQQRQTAEAQAAKAE